MSVELTMEDVIMTVSILMAAMSVPVMMGIN